ncbi:TetR/AcrR family transcriptional regulator [Flavobacterium sp.]|uniref:TetR/AcrR family transcriptional regulator n=1 Tax=Flavobacterium sp. TaxID=239 RepID=UPI00286C10FE|nr:TetR/AcrR family transcriptional regulator [Flavobacterium sp.]
MASKAERTKQFIIEKTAPIFNAKGYCGTSINDLMVATGLTKGSIYGNFESKDDVALEAFDYNFQKVILYIKSQMDQRPAIVDKLLVYPETYRNYSQLSFLSLGCPITNTATEADDTHPKLKTKANNAMLFWRNSLEKQLKIGIETGEIKPDVNVDEFIGVLIALIQGSLLQCKLTGKTNTLNTTMEYLERIILNLKK